MTHIGIYSNSPQRYSKQAHIFKILKSQNACINGNVSYAKLIFKENLAILRLK